MQIILERFSDGKLMPAPNTQQRGARDKLHQSVCLDNYASTRISPLHILDQMLLSLLCFGHFLYAGCNDTYDICMQCEV